MKLIRLLLMVAGCLSWATGNSHAAVLTQARLVLASESARAGDTVMAGVELSMPPRWHTYWRYAGDSGIPTKIEWRLPTGVTAGEIQWPPPEKDTVEELTTYVYRDDVLLLIPLKLANNLAPGRLQLKATVTWLECDKECLPGKGEVEAALVIGTDSKPSRDAGLIETWQKRIPNPSNPVSPKARWELTAKDDTRSLIVDWNSPSTSQLADFFPYANDDCEIGGATERLKTEGNSVSVRKTVKKSGEKWPSQIAGLLVVKESAANPRAAFEVNLTPSVAPTIASATPSTATANSNSQAQPKKSLARMLVLAFLGGLILNIMPCVLPVIALKILGFVNQSKEAPERVRQLGLIYAAGVLVSFFALAGIVIAVQQAGRAASWGMQFQNPQFVVGMTVLVTLVALNLFGLFEVTLSGGAMQAASALTYKEGGAGAFFNGVLATALATPCTAPFLGVALGFAFTQPPWVIALMFGTVGLGLAAPYVVLSLEPGWLKFLPKPGAWMEKFKIAMGFPMLATAIWLLWLTTSHFGRDGILWIGIFLATLSMSAWIWGEFVQRGRQHRGLAMAMSVILIAGGYYYALEKELDWRSHERRIAAGESSLASTRAGGIQWQRWSNKAVEEARKAGRPVLVDFTADWCVTCQVNKKTSIEIKSVEAKLNDMNAATLLGDYTNEDPAITVELKKYERAGVPLVLVFPADTNKAPIVLPEVLTPDIVLTALNEAGSSKMISQAEAKNTSQ